MWQYIHSDELYHHGIKGMKWGVRRYQNKDGSLTPEGKRRVKTDGTFKTDREYREEIRTTRAALTAEMHRKYGVEEAFNKADKEWIDRYQKGELSDNDSDIYKEAEELAKKSYNDVASEMKKKYGSDYDDFVKREEKQSVLVVAGVLLGGTALMASSISVVGKGLELAGSGAIKLVEAIANKASTR